MTNRTCRACYKQYRYPQPRGFERVDDGYCSYACVPTASEPETTTAFPSFDLSSVVADAFDSSPSVDTTDSSSSSDWGSPVDSSDSGFGGGGASGDF